MAEFATQEREARNANELTEPPASGRKVDRILWNHGRETVDEIVVNDCTVHLEQMSDTQYWMALYKGDGGRFVVDLYHDGHHPLLCTVYDDGPEPWHWDEDDEHA